MTHKTPRTSTLLTLLISLACALSLASLRLRPAAAVQSSNPRLGELTPENSTQGVEFQGSRRLAPLPGEAQAGLLVTVEYDGPGEVDETHGIELLESAEVLLLEPTALSLIR